MDDNVLKPGQELIEDNDFELAIIEKPTVVVSQNGMRLRPPSVVSAYNDFSVSMADGSVFLRKVNKFVTAE